MHPIPFWCVQGDVLAQGVLKSVLQQEESRWGRIFQGFRKTGEVKALGRAENGLRAPTGAVRRKGTNSSAGSVGTGHREMASC